MSTPLNPDLIAKAADVIDARRHSYRVNIDTWRPYCTCGWSAEESYDVGAYDRHLAELALEAVANDICAEALEAYARKLAGSGPDELYYASAVAVEVRSWAAALKENKD